MANFNKVILMGNLTRDPELRYTPKGTAIARIGMAINRRWKGESGEMQEETTFVDVDAFGRQAEVIAQYTKKGRPLMIEGRLRFDQWDDKQTGAKRSALKVVLESFSFIDGGRDSGGGGGGNDFESAAPRRPAPSSGGGGGGGGYDGPDDDDVPF